MGEGQLHVIALNPHTIEWRSARRPSRLRRMAGWCSHDHFRSSHGHRNGERNCLHRGHHDRVAVMLADKAFRGRVRPISGVSLCPRTVC